MRRWMPNELDAILSDMALLDGLSDPVDCEWLAGRIATRELHRTFGAGRCDACGIEGARLMIFVDEYPDDLGGPSTLGITYLCSLDR